MTVNYESCGFVPIKLFFVDAQTLDATTRLTNILYSADLQNTSSQAYRNLSESIIGEVGLGSCNYQCVNKPSELTQKRHPQIYQSLSPEMKALVDSGQVRIEIKGFAMGSVVVNFTIFFIPSQSQDIMNVSTALLQSLMDSSIYTVDRNNTSVNGNVYVSSLMSAGKLC